MRVRDLTSAFNQTNSLKFSDPNAPRPTPALLQCLATPPTAPLNPASSLSMHLASWLFSSLIRSSSRGKQLARLIKPAGHSAATAHEFFVPADGSPAARPEPDSPDEGDEGPQTLIALLAEHLSLSFLSRTHAASAETERDTREWDRLITIYLALLVQWLWEEPKAVREFLENGGVGMVRLKLSKYFNTIHIIASSSSLNR